MGAPLDFERLEVFRVAVEVVAVLDEVAERLPDGRGYMRDQLRRAANSIPLNIAEGAGEFAPAEKARFYRMARRSATECAGQIYRRRKCIPEPVFGQIKQAMGFRRFDRRGMAKAGGEWSLVCPSHNLRKLWRARLAGVQVTLGR